MFLLLKTFVVVEKVCLVLGTKTAWLGSCMSVTGRLSSNDKTTHNIISTHLR